MKTAIVIPAYNEEKTIADVISSARRYGKIIVVDDCSRDRTGEIARKSGAIVVSHKTNRGLGGALRTGFAEALKRKYDVIITLDADGQHNPDQIPLFTEGIRNGYGFVLGRRDLLRYPFVKKFGNFFLNLLTNLISGTNLKDTESGFRAFSRSALEKLYLQAEKYEIAVEIVFEVGRNGIRYTNVEIESPLYRKGVGFLDGVDNFRYLLRRRKRNIGGYVDDFLFVTKNAIRSVINS